jgi:hypothetical protein
MKLMEDMFLLGIDHLKRMDKVLFRKEEKFFLKILTLEGVCGDLRVQEHLYGGLAKFITEGTSMKWTASPVSEGRNLVG